MFSFRLLRRLFAAGLLALHLSPTVATILNPLLFVMWLPIGAYAILCSPWTPLAYLPDPLNPGQSLYWLTYAIRPPDYLAPLFPELFRWGVADLSLTVAGLMVFAAAFSQWLRGRRGLLTTGMYSVVRHPQYLGLILAALGLSLRSMRPVSLISWLTLFFAYLVLASDEEKGLFRAYGDAYSLYAQRVSFILPFFPSGAARLLPPPGVNRYLLLLIAYALFVALALATLRHCVYALR